MTFKEQFEYYDMMNQTIYKVVSPSKREFNFDDFIIMMSNVFGVGWKFKDCTGYQFLTY